MSIRSTAIVWEQSTAEGTELLLMLAIADISNDSGEGYPGVSKLAKRCRIKTERGIQKVIAKRVEAGELFVEPRYFTHDDGTKRQTSNLYSLLFRGLDNRHALKKFPPVLQDTHPPSGKTPTPRPTGHRGGELARTGESSLDPSLDPSLEQSGAEAARNTLIGAIVEVWVKGWAGAVSGNPYSNKTYRVDAGKLADSTSLDDIKRYTLAKAADKRWVNQRPSWGIWFNDLGAWLAANPAQPEPGKKQYGSGAELTESQRIALANMNKVMKGKQTP